MALTYPLASGPKPSAATLSGAGRCAGSPSSRIRCVRRCSPGDGLLALRFGDPRSGQLRVFPDPTMAVALARQACRRRAAASVGDAMFEACSDNPGAPGATDSDEFGWVPAAGSYRVVWTVRGS